MRGIVESISALVAVLQNLHIERLEKALTGLALCKCEEHNRQEVAAAGREIWDDLALMPFVVGLSKPPLVAKGLESMKSWQVEVRVVGS
jgi:hypothetical protein